MKLLEKLKMGPIELKNRTVMAPMTRSRADLKGIVSDITTTYYKQRSSAGLIVTEAINISPQAIGSPFTPGIYTKEQIEAWKKVTAAVHGEGGKIFAQLWHTGRVGHSIDRNGELPVSASAMPIKGQKHFTSKGEKDYETPRELSTSEVQNTIQDYGTAAINAIKAGFDGVELHAAFGYLPNQFLVESSNQRIDEYGGNIENRSKFILETISLLKDIVGKERVGIKLSPSSPFNSINDSDPKALYKYLIKELDKMDIAYIHLMQPMSPLDKFPNYPKDVVKTFGPLFKNTVIANAGYTRETAEAELQNNNAQLISFGSSFLANPDLPKRFELNVPLNEADKSTFYGGNAKGYIDYPRMEKM